MNALQRYIPRVAALGLAVATLIPSVRAEDPAPKDAPAPRPERPDRAGGEVRENAAPRRAAWVEQLQVTDEQRPKIQAAMDEQLKAMRAMRDDTALTPEKRREKLQAIRTEFTGKLKGILTADQFAQFEKIQAERGPGRRPGGAEGGQGVRERSPRRVLTPTAEKPANPKE